jgi:hypothetical protein
MRKIDDTLSNRRSFFGERTLDNLGEPHSEYIHKYREQMIGIAVTLAENNS